MNYHLSKTIFHFFLQIFISFFCSTLVSCSSDKTVACWDYETGMRIKRLKGHSSFVNSCCPARRGPELIASGSDDGTVKVCTIYRPLKRRCSRDTHLVLFLTCYIGACYSH